MELREVQHHLAKLGDRIELEHVPIHVIGAPAATCTCGEWTAVAGAFDQHSWKHHVLDIAFGRIPFIFVKGD